MIRLQLRVSWLEVFAVVACHGAALCSLPFSAISAPGQIFLGFFILALAYSQLRRALLLSPGSITRIDLGETSARVVSRDQSIVASLLRIVYLSQPLTILEFKRFDANQPSRRFASSKFRVNFVLGSISELQRRQLNGFLIHRFIAAD